MVGLGGSDDIYICTIGGEYHFIAPIGERGGGAVGAHLDSVLHTRLQTSDGVRVFRHVGFHTIHADCPRGFRTVGCPLNLNRSIGQAIPNDLEL